MEIMSYFSAFSSLLFFVASTMSKYYIWVSCSEPQHVHSTTILELTDVSTHLLHPPPWPLFPNSFHKTLPSNAYIIRNKNPCFGVTACAFYKKSICFKTWHTRMNNGKKISVASES